MKNNSILMLIGLCMLSENYSKPKNKGQIAQKKLTIQPKENNYDDYGNNDEGVIVLNSEKEFEEFMKKNSEMNFIKEDPYEFENKKINTKSTLPKKSTPLKKNNTAVKKLPVKKNVPIKNTRLNGRISKNRAPLQIDVYDFLTENIDKKFIDNYEEGFIKNTNNHFNAVLVNTKNYLKKNKIMPKDKANCMEILLLQIIFEVIKDDLFYGADEFDTASLNNFTFDIFNTIAEDYNFFENIILNQQDINSFDFNMLDINAAWSYFVFDLMECERCIYFLQNMTNENPIELKEFFNSFSTKYRFNIVFTDEELNTIFNEKSYAYKILANMFLKSKHYNDDKISIEFNFCIWSLLSDKSNFDNFLDVFNPYFDFIDNSILEIMNESNNTKINNKVGKNNIKNNSKNKVQNIINLADKIDQALVDMLKKLHKNSITTHDQMQKIYEYFEKTILEKMFTPEQKKKYFNFIL